MKLCLTLTYPIHRWPFETLPLPFPFLRNHLDPRLHKLIRVKIFPAFLCNLLFFQEYLGKGETNEREITDFRLPTRINHL
jgi:hypothetical protein